MCKEMEGGKRKDTRRYPWCAAKDNRRCCSALTNTAGGKVALWMNVGKRRVRTSMTSTGAASAAFVSPSATGQGEG